MIEGVGTCSKTRHKNWEMSTQGCSKQVRWGSPLTQKIVISFNHFPMEFGAHIWTFCSTHEYCKTTKYELQTPSGSGWTRSRFFLLGGTPSELVCYNHGYSDAFRVSLHIQFESVSFTQSYGFWLLLPHKVMGLTQSYGCGLHKWPHCF